MWYAFLQASQQNKAFLFLPLGMSLVQCLHGLETDRTVLNGFSTVLHGLETVSNGFTVSVSFWLLVTRKSIKSTSKLSHSYTRLANKAFLIFRDGVCFMVCKIWLKRLYFVLNKLSIISALLSYLLPVVAQSFPTACKVFAHH